MPPNATSSSSTVAASSSEPPETALAPAVKCSSSTTSGSNSVFSYTSNAVTAKASVIEFGKSYHSTGICFLDHMVDQLTSHGQLGVTMKVFTTADGESSKNHHQPHVDYAGGSLIDRSHDEDIFIACGASLGMALRDLVARRTALMEENTWSTSAVFLCPLDEALAEVTLKLCNTDDNEVSPSSLSCELAPYGNMPPKIGRRWIGCYRCNLTPTFFQSLFKELGAPLLLLKKMRGHNAHHVVESTFKAFARVFRACLDELTMGGSKHGCVEVGEERLASWRRKEEEERRSTLTNGCTDNDNHRTGSRSRSTKETTIEVNVDLDRCAPTASSTTIADSSDDTDAASSSIYTGVELTDQILQEIRRCCGFWFDVNCDGDIYIDDHHTSEDVAITVGQCLNQALGNKAGLTRMGCAEAMCGNATIRCTMDLSNRPYFEWDLPLDEEYVGGDDEAFAAMRRGAHARNQALQSKGNTSMANATMLCGSALTCEMLQHVFESLTIETRATVHLELMPSSKDGAAYQPQYPGHTKDLALAAARAFGTALAECVRVDPRRAGKVASSKGTLSV